MKKRSQINVLKLVSILILLIIIVISFLSIQRDATVNTIKIMNQEEELTGKAAVGLYVDGSNELKYRNGT